VALGQAFSINIPILSLYVPINSNLLILDQMLPNHLFDKLIRFILIFDEKNSSNNLFIKEQIIYKI